MYNVFWDIAVSLCGIMLSDGHKGFTSHTVWCFTLGPRSPRLEHRIWCLTTACCKAINLWYSTGLGNVYNGCLLPLVPSLLNWANPAFTPWHIVNRCYFYAGPKRGPLCLQPKWHFLVRLCWIPTRLQVLHCGWPLTSLQSKSWKLHIIRENGSICVAQGC